MRYISVVNIPRSTVTDAIRRYRETGLYLRNPGSDRLRATSYQKDRFIITSVIRDRALPATIIAQYLGNTTRTAVSAKTVRRRITEKPQIKNITHF